MSTATVPPAPTPTRSSARVRNKSARALESENTDRLLAAARERRTLASSVPLAAENTTSKAEEAEAIPVEGDEQTKSSEALSEPALKPKSAPKPKGKNRAAPRPKKPRRSKYCVCHEAREGPMIECGECGNWFHFGCVNVPKDEAERIRVFQNCYSDNLPRRPTDSADKYVCSHCEKPEVKTTYTHDIESFPSPPPPSDVEIKVPAKRKAPGKRTAKEHSAPQSPQQPTAVSPARSDISVHESGNGSGGESESGSGGDEESSDTEDSAAESEYAGSAPSVAGLQKTPAKRARRNSPVPGLGERKTSLVPSASAPKTPAERKPSISSPVTEQRPTIDRKRSSTGSVKPGGLPPARQYVLEKMAATMRAVFGDDKMDESASKDYGRELEEAIFFNFKDVVNGKEAAGGRYKAQFNLLHGSLSKEVRPDLKASIVDGSLTPAKISLLKSDDLATAEQLAEIEKAQQEALRQTVKVKEEIIGIRLGRDGFEKIENQHDAEMKAIRRAEELQRRRESRPEGEDEDEPENKEENGDSSSSADEGAPLSATTPVPESPSEAPMSPKRPSLPRIPIPPRRLSSSGTQSPIVSKHPGAVPRSPTVELNSAWSTNVVEEDDEEMEIDGDQNAVDLSDIIPAEDIDYGDGLDDRPQGAMDELLARSISWSGGITNPAKESAIVSPIHLRLITDRVSPPQADYWGRLLPQPVVAITGRVPTKHSTQYLTDRLHDRSKELITVIFTLDPKATPEEQSGWDELISFHIERDRHPIYHPYGERPPPGTARELYLIPLRPGDASPDFTAQLDNYALPLERDRSVIVGVFVASRETPSGSGANNSPMERPVPDAGPQAGGTLAGAAPPVLPNMQLQALMASLNPAAIASALGGGSAAPPPPPPTPPVPGFFPPSSHHISPSFPPYQAPGSVSVGDYGLHSAPDAMRDPGGAGLRSPQGREGFRSPQEYVGSPLALHGRHDGQDHYGPPDRYGGLRDRFNPPGQYAHGRPVPGQGPGQEQGYNGPAAHGDGWGNGGQGRGGGPGGAYGGGPPPPSAGGPSRGPGLPPQGWRGRGGGAVHPGRGRGRRWR